MARPKKETHLFFEQGADEIQIRSWDKDLNAAVGDKPDKTLYESVKDLVPECYLVGDAAGGGIIPNAVFDGYAVGAKL